jgi:hypothetical protein
MRRWTSCFAALTIAGVAGAACSAGDGIRPTDGLLALGTWGGDSAAMIVGDTAMHIHVGCTFGDVSGRIHIDAANAFDVSGSYMLHAFPVATGPSVPARFVGKIVGQTAVVTIAVDDTVEHRIITLGPVSVSLGETPRLMPCPICRRPIVTRTWRQ